MADYDHWMRFNIGDYLADTMHLTTLQHGIYLRLIWHYFKRRGLPDDERTLARIAGITAMIWRRDAAPVMALFRREKGVWLHAKIDAEIAHSREVQRKRADAGKAGASSRWSMANAIDENGKCHRFANGKRMTRARATPEPEPESKNPPVAPLAGRRADGSNPRSQETNPRATGDNPRSLGTNLRALDNPRRRRSRNGFIEIMLEEMEARRAEEQPDDDGPRVVQLPRRADRDQC